MKIVQFAAILALTLCSGPRLHAQLLSDDELFRNDAIMAVINDTVITKFQVLIYTESARDALAQQSVGQPQTAYNQKFYALINDGLQQLVERQLILRDFTDQGYRMPESYLEELVQERIRETYSDRVTLMKSLQAQGKTFESFREDVRDQAIWTFMNSKNVAQEVIISPYKIQVYYQAHQDDFKVDDEVKLRLIVLKKTSADDTNAVALAREIRDKIKEGASFADMASVYSQDPQRSQGGERPWQERSVMLKELGDAAATLPVGQVSDAIDTPDACYLMLVEDKRPAHIKPMIEVRDEIEKTLRADEQARLKKQWIARLKAKSFILYF
jgi:peptidyl-prolyl cis-trans isomerase SurA